MSFQETESYHSMSDSSKELDLARKIIDLVIEYKAKIVHKDLVSAKWSRQDAGDKKEAYYADMRQTEQRASTIINELMELAEQYQETQGL